ncbi:biotin--[acetyl-CoA-carboxylase] ligase [Pareuzebyella sediminis]|uniref:biotin--[acetyl-CoA-carboxylase] ligase n=1 Tax=Pareuzebyella sediminis TaxID=2607998 RepID=UPI0011F0488F|nr:biotin--[acetyl-CoA-carboxylase] ligase [Pareuzebyella sediminis]
MQLIKLDATDSTNDYLKSLAKSKYLDDFTVVTTKNQLKGKGQMGAKWYSEPGKNLTCSVLKKNMNIPISDQFALNCCTSLAVYNTLKAISVPNLSIKWPNDILSGSHKICGILIENICSGGLVRTSIIGIGLNVNQQNFNNLQNASSLKMLLGKALDIGELLCHIVSNLEEAFKSWERNGYRYLLNHYENHLFRRAKPSTFKNSTDELFMGFITGVTKEGKLIITLEDNVLREFDRKEIQLLY